MKRDLKRIVLGVQYDGLPWYGWQTQPDGRTVQDQLEVALKKFTLTDIATTCAGRTDRGVHAIEQIVHFDTDIERAPFSWVRGVNAFLPSSIAVCWARDVGAVHTMNAEDDADVLHNFHARFSAVARTYVYVLHNSPIRSPLVAGKVGWVFQPLDADAMHEAAQVLVGTHDFSAFRASECQAKSPIKVMHSIDVKRHGEWITVTICANAFLQHMVRNIVASLIFVGTGKHSLEWLRTVLQNGDRSRAAPTLMPDGLYLAKIDYDKKWDLPQVKTYTLPFL